MGDADELWKVTVESQRSKSAPSSSATTPQQQLPFRAWSRFDLNAKRYRGSNSKGPLWGDCCRRITIDLDFNQVIKDEVLPEEMTPLQAHAKLPEGVESIETILIYRQVPGHPNGRLPNRSKVFGLWRADDITEWGDKGKFPVIANGREINVFSKLEKTDCYYVLRGRQLPLTYLTKQSGKELDWNKLNNDEKGMFLEAKILEITSLVNSNAIRLVKDRKEVDDILTMYPHRVMPSRFIFTKKSGEVGERWKAKARWILLGHKDPDALELERYAPTLSSTTVMLALQVIASMRYRLFIMDVSSAFGQSDPHEREQGPLYAWMPPTGIPDCPDWALVHVLTAVYGLVNAPAVWQKTVRRHLLELGYVESILDPCLYYLPPDATEKNEGAKFQVAGIVLLDVDDLC